LSTPQPLWAEQQPTDWWEGATASIRTALETTGVSGAEIVAIGLTGQMHGLVALDAKGEVVRPAILWNDQRTAMQCDEIRLRVGRERLIQITGNDALPGFTAPKILWVAEHEPEVYARIRHILLPKDYVRYRLTGDYAMDKADGSGTILFDLRARDWSPDVLAALRISADWLPPTYEGPTPTGVLSFTAAEQTGLRAGTPVVAGGGDQAAQAVGVGATRSGIAALTLGTSGVVFATTDEPLIEPEGRLHAFCHAVPGRWHLMGVTLSAAGSLQWYRDALAPNVSFDVLVSEAEEAPAGSDGLLFLPYLMGERTPYPDPLARGAWVGLTARHTRAHLTRAILEGVAFSLKDTFELMRGAGLASLRETRVSGGGARSLLWRRILASVLGVELESAPTTEGAAYGAALLAGVGAGAWPDVDAATQAVASQTEQAGDFPRVAPDAADAEVYTRLYAQYRALYPALKPTFDGLSVS
ncbi:MAG TPA: xylulokinase, partial [Ktedonobacterales bacterium]|nr:xylulokinase [Ktedonobacterales bacterium]